VRNWFRSLPTGGRTLILGAFLAWLLILIGDRVSEYRVSQLAMLAAYFVGVLSIVLLTGLSGQVSLGHGALLAVGAYAAALAMMQWNIPAWQSFFIAVAAAALVGAILGVAAARLSGPYLAGATLAFAVGLPSLTNEIEILGGESGLLFDVGFAPDRFGDEFTEYKWFFWIAAAGAIISLIFARNLFRSRYRRVWRAIRGDEISASLSGIHVARSKVLAFTVSAGFAGLAGALYATQLAYVTPGAFGLSLSFALITGAVIGGLGSIAGAFVGAAVLVFLSPIIDWVTELSGAPEGVAISLPGILTGLLLLFTVLTQPEGIVGSIHHHRRYRSSH
jgi:branched-chain amino acid transport system permease protein